MHMHEIAEDILRFCRLKQYWYFSAPNHYKVLNKVLGTDYTPHKLSRGVYYLRQQGILVQYNRSVSKVIRMTLEEES